MAGAQMRCASAIMKFEIIAEHRQQMLFKAHDQWMDPTVENDIGAFKTHLGREARRKILNVDG